MSSPGVRGILAEQGSSATYPQYTRKRRLAYKPPPARLSSIVRALKRSH